MNYFSYNIDLFLFISAIAVSVLGFLFYYYVPGLYTGNKMQRSEKGNPQCVLHQRLWGFLIFGCLPLSIIFLSGTKNLSQFGLVPPKMESYFWTMVLSLIIVPMNYFIAGTKGNLKMYPQIREVEWPFGLIVQSAVSWILYLFSYEFLFRGFLFFASLPVLGLPMAIVLNTIIYALVHLPKGYREIIGSVPLGILICYLTFITGSIWVAVFSHIVLALSSEWFSLRAHPQMVIKRNGR
jgi:membrane protease YdiL (CAAX protease family)